MRLKEELTVASSGSNPFLRNELPGLEALGKGKRGHSDTSGH
jgi:hypothetical protein